MSSIKQLENLVQETVGEISHSIAYSLKQSIEEVKGMVTPGTPYFKVMRDLGFVEKNSAGMHEGLIYRLTPRAEEAYRTLFREGFYER